MRKCLDQQGEMERRAETKTSKKEACNVHWERESVGEEPNQREIS